MVARRCSARLSTGSANGLNGPGAGGAEGARRARDADAAARRRARAVERAQEVEDGPQVLRAKCRRLARALQAAKHLVVFTGAGISTAAAIPDYRGPRGVWTRLRRGEPPPRVDVARASPTLTHMALTALWARGTLKFVVSQNCDGLHVRAGLPRRALAELHGDMYAERCAACRRVYLRAFDTTERTARHAHGTRRLCHACGRELRDSIVHFGERGRAAWPLNWAGALRHAARADVVLCLGSSLKVLRRYPRLWRMQCAPAARPRVYIVNLQWTPKDAAAALKINARCDAVMAQVARRLGLRVPAYEARGDPLRAHAVPLAPAERHTTRARPLPPAEPDGDGDGDTARSSSDEELPLRALQARLREPALRAFRVALSSGHASILLRARHAPAEGAAPVSALRRFRMQRAPRPPKAPPWPPAAAAAPAPDGVTNGETNGLKEETRKEASSSSEWSACEGDGDGDGETETEEAQAAAAAYFARAVVLCRGRLYPGLHTIVGEGGNANDSNGNSNGGGGGAECGWCLRRHGARRCLWYGPPPPADAPRAAHRRTGALCACCDAPGLPGTPGTPGEGQGGDDRPPSPEPSPPPAGWYGKGYRKGRRR